MTVTRRYRLLCPIARALDTLGDRWALLILRDLHAGAARFSDLQLGLTGIATNLLATRLSELVEARLVRKVEGPYSVALYELTGLGRATSGILFELAAFGARLSPDPEVRRPGNLRSVAVTLSVACTRVVDPTLKLRCELRISGEPFTLDAQGGVVNVRSGSCGDASAVIETDYEPMIAVTDGQLGVEAFAHEHVRIVSGDAASVGALLGLLGAASTLIARSVLTADASRRDPTVDHYVR